ncbi:unnamed protein product [Lymnaea stagnalis]|uniref:Zinc finger protein 865 n=1 Tax=Lymnaea stagnalis TaxID=6523 RepID=A0AAV2H1S0_LYMST
MTEHLNDNNPNVDTLEVTEFEAADQTLLTDLVGDDDFFFCRKCNKIFKNLPQYLEHKIKDENYRIAQMRSKADRRMLIPQLVQKRKRQSKISTKSEEGKIVDSIENSQSKKLSQVQIAINSCEKSPQEPKLENIEIKQEAKEEKVPKKRGRKKKSATSGIQILSVAQSIPQENTYICNKCDRKFRREATLRWHMTYDHKDTNNSEDSDSSEEDIVKEELDDNDEEFKVENLQQGKDEEQTGVPELKTQQEICIVIEQPQTEHNHLVKNRLQKQEKIEEVEKDTDIPLDIVKKEMPDRPYSCEICGRCFKELTVLKAHSVVHSDERKFVCETENCPYGFKTKGGLVRHMRRHTGERPFACEKCGRAFSESGALSRHMKARRNCSQTPDSGYPRYKKNWTYHPNIPAVIDPNQRDAQRGRSTLPIIVTNNETSASDEGGEIHYIITESSEPDVIDAEVVPQRVQGIAPQVVTGDILIPERELGTETKLDHKEKGLEIWVTGPAEEEFASVETATDTESAAIVVEASIASYQELPGEPVAHENVIIVSDLQKDLTTRPDSQQNMTGRSNQPDELSTRLRSEDNAEVENPEEMDTDVILMKSSAEVELLKSTQCHVCKKDFVAVEGLEIHLRSHLADQPSRCGLCHFLSNGREELRQHILYMHQDSLNDIEASVLSMEEDMNLKKGETMQDRKTVLRNALTAVKQLYSIKKNKASVETEKPGPSATGTLQCMVCNRYFRGSSYLRQHMRTHTGERPHQCQHCHRSFTSRDILKKHMYVHKDRRDFKCGECGKLFKSLSHVQQHLRIHSQDRPFRCSICDKLFKTQVSLKVHLRTHTGVNPYKCHVCNHHFRERGSLQRHMRLHTGEKPYKCNLCNRAFAEQGTLSRHLRAKMPCATTREATSLDSSNTTPNTTMLAQFSTMVADTQHYILPEAEPSQQFILSSNRDQEMSGDYVILQTVEEMEDAGDSFEVITEERAATVDGNFVDQSQDTERLEIFDSSTGESLIIVADKSIVDLVRDQQGSLESGDGGCSMERIKDILLAAGKGGITATFQQEELTGTGTTPEEISPEQEERISPENMEIPLTQYAPDEGKSPDVKHQEQNINIISPRTTVLNVNENN